MRPYAVLLPLFLLAACAPLSFFGRNAADPDADPHSYANVQDFRTRHLVLDLQVDFDARQLAGTAELQLERLNPDARRLVLDTRALQVEAVEVPVASGWAAAPFRLRAPDPILGSALVIEVGTADRVRIRYRTQPEASGLQWLTAEQTAGRRHPFMFSQSQAIHARSWVPLQDTPRVRATYEARINAPAWAQAVMSAEKLHDREARGAASFRMPQPIPSYLLAIAVGDLRFQSLGPRTGVYAEPPMIKAAVREFEDTERMLAACERLFGPYRWGRYDLLILPPSFPFGGMENPRLTFASPTTIAGDKSLVSLVAHELAHSWSGNLVTNSSWRDLWLNEGFTTYLTYRIMEAVYGKQRADMERALGAADLRAALAKQARPGDRTLSPDLKGQDPEVIFSDVPYERGALFLTYLESRVGRPAFDAFLRGWFEQHAFRSVSRDDFLAYLQRELIDRHPTKLDPEVILAWIHDPEVPAEAVWPSSPAFAAVDAQRSAWLSGRKSLNALPTARWTVHEWRYFLDGMPRDLDAARMRALDQRFRLSQSRNAFVALSWFRLAVAADYRPAWPAIERHLLSIGRTLLIRPLYEALAATPEGREFAQRVYAQARDGYHPITRAAVERAMAGAAAG